jgi:energy-coupling factor transporter ATP-binding protein EcfA2
MNGYKTVSLHCRSRVKVVAGENGAGKTSLLNALYSVLAGKPSILYKIDFERLDVEWASGESFQSLKPELFPKVDEARLRKSSTLDFFVSQGSSTEDALELLRHFIVGDDDAITSSAAYQQIYQDSPYDKEEIYGFCKRAVEGVTQPGRFDELFQQVKRQIGDISVLYLPTYRRIEADLFEFRTRPSASPRRPRTTKDGWDSDRLIFFGLEDVENKLKSISLAIRKETLDAYSRISGKTLEELLTANSTDESAEAPLDLQSIQLILSRIGKQSTDVEARIKDLITSEAIYEDRYFNLRRFLRQLTQVYTGRQGDEKAIEDFAKLVNSYLSLGGEPEKLFSFDKQRVELQAINRFTKLPIPLGALSSGEKQLVSVFARLLLDPQKRFFIIIDEPELSLSIEWQERFLPDIAATTSCAQLIAITHSPFIYKNNLASVAGSMDVSYKAPVSTSNEAADE